MKKIALFLTLSTSLAYSQLTEFTKFSPMHEESSYMIMFRCSMIENSIRNLEQIIRTTEKIPASTCDKIEYELDVIKFYLGDICE